MSSFVKILLSVPDSIATMKSKLNFDANATSYSAQAVEALFSSVVNGNQVSYAKVSVGALQATGTVTFSSFVADDTVTVNGVVFTGKVSPSTTTEFAIGSSNTECATNFAAKINASALAHIVGVVTATSALAVVTLTAVQPGLSGNQQTLAISAHGSVSAARLASGSDGTQVATNYGASS
jgi:phage tail sheath gpL-like